MNNDKIIRNPHILESLTQFKHEKSSKEITLNDEKESNRTPPVINAV